MEIGRCVIKCFEMNSRRDRSTNEINFRSFKIGPINFSALNAARCGNFNAMPACNYADLIDWH